MRCKNNINNFCTHYNKASPPQKICDRCEHFEPHCHDCEKHIYDEDWCLDRSSRLVDEWLNRKTCKKENCKLIGGSSQ